MKKFILGLTTCVALVGGTCLFSGCKKNDEALAKVTSEWNEIKKNSYVGEDGLLDNETITNTKGVAKYREAFEFDGTKKINLNSLSTLIQPYFMKNVMAPLTGIDSLPNAKYKANLPKKDLSKLGEELKDLKVALTNYTEYVDGMQRTINAGATLLYGDLVKYESLASVVVSEAFEASDIYIDMLYNNMVNCNIPENTTEVSAEAATLITQKLSNELAHTFHSVYYKLTGFESITIATGKSQGYYNLNVYENSVVKTYSENVTDTSEIAKIKDMQSHICLLYTSPSPRD